MLRNFFLQAQQQIIKITRTQTNYKCFRGVRLGVAIVILLLLMVHHNEQNHNFAINKDGLSYFIAKKVILLFLCITWGYSKFDLLFYGHHTNFNCIYLTIILACILAINCKIEKLSWYGISIDFKMNEGI